MALFKAVKFTLSFLAGVAQGPTFKRSRDEGTSVTSQADTKGAHLPALSLRAETRGKTCRERKTKQKSQYDHTDLYH